ncbi:hypothetical protein [Brevibacterium aurantiacum]|nr:hypothetical protein [Brevibacterium aurantiacum]
MVTPLSGEIKGHVHATASATSATSGSTLRYIGFDSAATVPEWAE